MSASVTPLRPKKAKPEPAAQAATRSFTSWKLDILDGLSADERVPHWLFRTAFRVMQAVNSETRVAILSDATLCDDIPRMDRWRCQDAREQLEALEWWKVERGHGAKGSRYMFSPANINAMLDRRALKKDVRDSERIKRKTRDKRRKCNVVSDTTLMPEGDGVSDTAGSRCSLPPVHRHSHLQEESLIEKEDEDRALTEHLLRKCGPVAGHGARQR